MPLLTTEPPASGADGDRLGYSVRPGVTVLRAVFGALRAREAFDATPLVGTHRDQVVASWLTPV